MSVRSEKREKSKIFFHIGFINCVFVYYHRQKRLAGLTDEEEEEADGGGDPFKPIQV